MNNIYPKGWPNWLHTFDHIGSHYPFHINGDNSEFYLKIGDALENIPPEDRVLDLAGATEILSRRWAFGNRTLITKLKRTPWMAKPVDNGWEYQDIPSHNKKRVPTVKVVQELEDRLTKEAKLYTEGYSNIGLLLSGGLDSRVVAGILKKLQLKGDIEDVTALTWGLENSRDVKYSQRISDEFGWEFRHFPVGADVLKRNIKITGELGAEFSPLNLHSIPEVRSQTDIEVILAGSYGNSVGRAEYAGRDVTNIERAVPRRLNTFGIFSNNIVSTYRGTVYDDAYEYRTRVARRQRYQYRELERQVHYMRRLLQPCMTHIAEKIPLYQLFTSPSVVKYMWSLDPEIRGKDHIANLLKGLPGELDTIPDAKSGIAPNQSNDNKDDFRVEFHNYGRWLREDIRSFVIDLVNNENIQKLLNESSLNRLLSIWSRANTITANTIDHIVSWLASLSIFIEKYNITVPSTQNSPIDRLNSVIGPATAIGYQTTRGLLRK